MTTKQHTRLVKEIANQRKWIEGCEANGVSYADGERGIAIRQADENHLKALQSQADE